MHSIASLLLAIAAIPVHAQGSAVNAMTIAMTLNNSQTQWVFNHICVPTKLLKGQGFTHGDFADAYLVVSRTRWELALEALSNNNEKESMKPLALVLHGIIDAYWPGRVERDSSGAITKFRDCEQLGNLQGMLHEERTGNGPNSALKDEATRLMTEVIRKWKDRRPFDEVAPLLSAGPMKLSSNASSQPLSAE